MLCKSMTMRYSSLKGLSMDVRPDYSVRLTAGDSEYLISPRYDFIRLFPAIGWGILNIVTDNGIATLHLTEAQARRVHQQSEIPLIEMGWITDHDYERYLDAQTNSLDDDWLK